MISRPLSVSRAAMTQSFQAACCANWAQMAGGVLGGRAVLAEKRATRVSASRVRGASGGILRSSGGILRASRSAARRGLCPAELLGGLESRGQARGMACSKLEAVLRCRRYGAADQ